MNYQLPTLPYDYDALEPVISKEIMELHHSKHHQGYVDKLNNALERAPELRQRALVDLLGDLDNLPDSVRTVIRNNGGGHYNHSLFWEIMSPDGGGEPKGELANRLNEQYGGFEQFVAQFNEQAAGLFGSGWVWLTQDLQTIPLPNQDTPMMLGKGEPILGLDVWEHAYYLDYKNVRADYISAWWKVVNWREVEKRFSNTAQ